MRPRAFGADAIVMGTDRDRGMVGDFMWSQEPHRVARRSRIPVHLVPVPERLATKSGKRARRR